jgi:predicted phage baseplate assembly protein
MLNKRNLDDQSYRSIVEAALGRLPWLCPAWTDHNAHDPGITVLELMGWYKEMQQYQMNQFTDALKEKLLKLAGVYRRPAAPARCSVVLPEDGPARLAGARLKTPQGILFELERSAPARRTMIDRVRAGDVELWEMLQAGGLTFQPFAFGGRENTELRIGLRQLGRDTLRLWFQVEEPEGVPRNPFRRSGQRPRELVWTLEGAGAVKPALDETHALSQSGYVEFALPENWRADPADGLWWLTVRQTDPGCEESVRLSGLSACRWQAVQRETWARSFCFAAPEDRRWEIRLADAMARNAQLAVFLRRDGGWEQTATYETERGPEGLLVRLDTTGTRQDGGDNVWVVCLDPARYGELLFDTAGLPGETISLHLDGKQVLPETFTLLCRTLDTDGQIRLLPWRCVDTFSACGPRDRVFLYDPLRETLTFGNGEYGSLVQKGEGAVLVTGMVLSLCGGGNIPAGAGLRFLDDKVPADNDAAVGGADLETTDEAAARFLRQLRDTEKCASAADYEHLARTTPGLRVAAAKALPGYDPDEPTGSGWSPTVTVVVVPASSGPRPRPDGRFLAEVQARLDRLRPICTRVRVIAPVYEEVYASVRLQGTETVTEETVRRLAEDYLSAAGAGIGGPVRPEELAARLQAMPGVLRVRQVDLRAPGPGCYQDASGDIRLARHAIPVLRELKLERIPEERAERG